MFTTWHQIICAVCMSDLKGNAHAHTVNVPHARGKRAAIKQCKHTHKNQYLAVALWNFFSVRHGGTQRK